VDAEQQSWNIGRVLTEQSQRDGERQGQCRLTSPCPYEQVDAIRRQAAASLRITRSHLRCRADDDEQIRLRLDERLHHRSRGAPQVIGLP
jgi:hypothetical protein